MHMVPFYRGRNGALPLLLSALPSHAAKGLLEAERPLSSLPPLSLALLALFLGLL